MVELKTLFSRIVRTTLPENVPIEINDLALDLSRVKNEIRFKAGNDYFAKLYKLEN